MLLTVLESADRKLGCHLTFLLNGEDVSSRVVAADDNQGYVILLDLDPTRPFSSHYLPDPSSPYGARTEMRYGTVAIALSSDAPEWAREEYERRRLSFG